METNLAANVSTTLVTSQTYFACSDAASEVLASADAVSNTEQGFLLLSVANRNVNLNLLPNVDSDNAYVSLCTDFGVSATQTGK